MNSHKISRVNQASARERAILEIGLAALRIEAKQTMEDAFIAAVLDNPYDPTPRLIFADWLDEQGRTEEARMVRSIAAQTIDGNRVTVGNWSVVRRTTEGANGGNRQFYVSWQRLTIKVVRRTKNFAFLADGKRLALDTLTACVEVI